MIGTTSARPSQKGNHVTSKSNSSARHHPPPFHIVLNQSLPEKGLNINSPREAVLQQNESAIIASHYLPLTICALEKTKFCLFISIPHYLSLLGRFSQVPVQPPEAQVRITHHKEPTFCTRFIHTNRY